MEDRPLRRRQSIPGLPWWELPDALVNYVINLAKVQSLDQMMKDAPLHKINQVKPQQTGQQLKTYSREMVQVVKKDKKDQAELSPGQYKAQTAPIVQNVSKVVQEAGAVYLQALNKKTAYKKLCKMMINLYAGK